MFSWDFFISIDFCFDIKLTTKEYASEITWSFGNWCNNSQQYQNNRDYSQTCCISTVPDWQHELKCIDSVGDGWHGAFITIDGRNFCDDFSAGYEKIAAVEANPSKHKLYTNFQNFQSMLLMIDKSLFLTYP